MSSCPHMLSVEHHVWAEAREAEGRKSLASKPNYQFASTRRLVRELETGARSPTTVDSVAETLRPTGSRSLLEGTRRAAAAPPTIHLADPYGVWERELFVATRAQLAEERAAHVATFNEGTELPALERYRAILEANSNKERPFENNYYPPQGYTTKPTLW
eukprot:a188260_58.p1 GENE.a188260_58~~a188260_58.p1  ORF type:complete len:173 (+),score=27.22 a188260_58:41-520(+)